METIDAVKNDAKKIRKSIRRKLKKAAVVTAVGGGFIALTYAASKAAVKSEFDSRILQIEIADSSDDATADNNE